ncbi:aldehyde dehydrogenase (NADP(+)) [Pedomonas sp. V897]|uniref:aldehyde dehydrogenase (NADP(+)) n=1 Tax=Pedomonas sp. V897 TaxID=3446482 RepID=UPI003EE0FD79
MALTGELFIAGQRRSSTETFKAIDPSTGEHLPTEFSIATVADVEEACRAAEAAFIEMRGISHERRAGLLEAIADAIMELGDELLERANKETGLPLARLTGERGRTVGQLRLFAAEIRSGGWQGIRIDPAMPERTPMPRSDLRLRKVPLGPVAVFGASNFPLAFSVAGGDTASALAAGCPVVVKGHSAHPGTSELVASAITRAVAATGFPAGTFSLVNGPGNLLGTALVANPVIQAVGFTGSRGGGLALMKVASERPVPIPVYAEMSSINPILLFPAALAARAEDLGRAFVGSLTMGAGQFCTNPGLVLAVDGPDLERFIAAAAEAVSAAPAATMLTPGIYKAYCTGVDQLSSNSKVKLVARGQAGGTNACQAALFTIAAEDFLQDESAAQEVFGASSVVVRCADFQQLIKVLGHMEGQLTASLHFDEADHGAVAQVVPVLERLAGRLVANGWPTGVEVCHAMVHGGPFPSTSDGRTTSVGTLAIERFLRPVCYQDFPNGLLPEVLRDGNLAGVPHRLDGVYKVG